MSLTNSCDQEPLKDSADDFLTRKLNRERHGVGQKSIKRAVEKYGGNIEQQYDKETCLYR
ncbi:GHKL domain-containing protein [Acutalibacter muris]|uniref:GHKL domain-containing protein n=1 Tax=Acutalibacter muris TaxID=1796620 RepID=UPI003FA4A662